MKHIQRTFFAPVPVVLASPYAVLLSTLSLRQCASSRGNRLYELPRVHTEQYFSYHLKNNATLSPDV